MECIKCGKKAKYRSTKYISPLCLDCAIEETKKLEGNDEIYTVSDYFDPIIEVSLRGTSGEFKLD